MYVIGILMDPIESVNFKTDTSISIINSLQKKARIKLILPNTIFAESNCFKTVFHYVVKKLSCSK